MLSYCFPLWLYYSTRYLICQGISAEFFYVSMQDFREVFLRNFLQNKKGPRILADARAEKGGKRGEKHENSKFIYGSIFHGKPQPLLSFDSEESSLLCDGCCAASVVVSVDCGFSPKVTVTSIVLPER